METFFVILVILLVVWFVGAIFAMLHYVDTNRRDGEAIVLSLVWFVWFARYAFHTIRDKWEED